MQPHQITPEPGTYEDLPPLLGRRVALRPVIAQDYDFLYAISLAPENLVRWRFRGATPSPEAFGASLWQGVLTQFMITRADGDERVGLISAYNPDFRNQTAHLMMIVAPQFERHGWVMDATTLFLTYLFETWNFRKIYYESIEFNYARIASGAGTHFQVEGCLKNHEFHAGRFWHVYLLAVYRDEYRKFSAPFLSRVMANGVESLAAQPRPNGH